MNRSVEGGIICPITTPLRDGVLAEDVLRFHINTIIGDLDGVLVNGSSGEYPWLPTAISTRTARVVVDEVAGRVPVYQGVGDTSTPRTLHRVETEAVGDFLMVTPPTYFAMGSTEMVRHFVAVAESSPRPILLYNIPQHTGATIPTTAVAELSTHSNIVGIKDSAGDPFLFAEYLAATDRDSFTVLQGREQLMMWSYSLGAAGLVSSMANFAPHLLASAKAALDGAADFAQLQSIQNRIVDLGRVFNHGHWLAALKTSLILCGLHVGAPTTPMSPSSPTEVEAIAAILSEHDSRTTTFE